MSLQSGDIAEESGNRIPVRWIVIIICFVAVASFGGHKRWGFYQARKDEQHKEQVRVAHFQDRIQAQIDLLKVAVEQRMRVAVAPTVLYFEPFSYEGPSREMLLGRFTLCGDANARNGFGYPRFISTGTAPLPGESLDGDKNMHQFIETENNHRTFTELWVEYYTAGNVLETWTYGPPPPGR